MIDAMIVEGAGAMVVGRSAHVAIATSDASAIRGPAEPDRILLAIDARLDGREELAEAVRLRADETDDRTLIAASLAKWSLDALPKLIGDWSLIWFDNASRKLFLARDPLGGRPLFWRRQKHLVAAASMPRGLYSHPEIDRAPDVERVARLLGSVASRDERSFFAGINRVIPGHVVSISEDGLVTDQRFWNPVPRHLKLGGFDDYVDAYRSLLDRAVADRTRHMPAVAAQLSGGWDSSSVVATAARQGTSIDAFTAVPAAGFTAAPFKRFADERANAAAVASLYPNQIRHRLVEHPHRSPIAHLDADLALYDRPMVNRCNHVWLRAIREQARARGQSVMLTGEIGNFTISNAPSSILADFVLRGAWGDWSRESWLMWRTRRARIRGVLANSFAPWVPDRLWQRLERLGSAGPLANQTILNPMRRGAMLNQIVESARDWRPKSFVSSTLSGIQDLDFGEYHRGVSDGWGLEKRDPTADTRIIQFMISLPPEMYLRNGIRRPLARAALADRLPARVLNERQKGYQASDWHVGLTADLDNVRTLIDRIGADPLASSVLDVPVMRQLVNSWPMAGWERPEIIARYRIALLTGLSAGHFLVSV